MPRRAERARRRAMGLCVECSTPSDAARCPPCKRRERPREAGVPMWRRLVAQRLAA